MNDAIILVEQFPTDKSIVNCFVIVVSRKSPASPISLLRIYDS